MKYTCTYKVNSEIKIKICVVYTQSIGFFMICVCTGVWFLSNMLCKFSIPQAWKTLSGDTILTELEFFWEKWEW